MYLEAYFKRYSPDIHDKHVGAAKAARTDRAGHASVARAVEPSSMSDGLNAAPTIYEAGQEQRSADDRAIEADPDQRDQVDSIEIFDLIRDIKDPEHPNTLEQLNVAQRQLITVDDERGLVTLTFTPTIPHCSMATLIGLSIRVKLLRSLPPRFKVDVAITPGTHASEHAVNKQLNDKERVAAALENDNLRGVVDKCLAGVAD